MGYTFEKIAKSLAAFFKWLLGFHSKPIHTLGQYAKEDAAKGYVSIKTIMLNVSQLFVEAQQVVNQKNLELAQKLLESENSGFSLLDNRMIAVSSTGNTDPNVIPFTEMVSHRNYKISELSIQFWILETRARKRFTILPFDSPLENAKRAVINIRAAEKTICEFSIDDKIVATL